MTKNYGAKLTVEDELNVETESVLLIGPLAAWVVGCLERGYSYVQSNSISFTLGKHDLDKDLFG